MIINFKQQIVLTYVLQCVSAAFVAFSLFMLLRVAMTPFENGLHAFLILFYIALVIWQWRIRRRVRATRAMLDARLKYYEAVAAKEMLK